MFDRIKNKYTRRILKIVIWVIGIIVAACILFYMLICFYPRLVFSAFISTLDTWGTAEGYYRKIFDPCYKLVDSEEYNPKEEYVIRTDRVCLNYDTFGNWSKLKTLSTEPETFEILSAYYTKDKDNVYYDGGKIRGADPETFKVLSSYYGKDKNNVYLSDKKVSGADINTFELLGSGYEKDKNNVYYDGEKISNADPETFEIIDFSFLYEYAKDKNNVYCNNKKIRDADPQTFEIIDMGYTKDKNYMYYKCEKDTNEIRFKDVIKNFFK